MKHLDFKMLWNIIELETLVEHNRPHHTIKKKNTLLYFLRCFLPPLWGYASLRGGSFGGFVICSTPVITCHLFINNRQICCIHVLVLIFSLTDLFDSKATTARCLLHHHLSNKKLQFVHQPLDLLSTCLLYRPKSHVFSIDSNLLCVFSTDPTALIFSNESNLSRK